MPDTRANFDPNDWVDENDHVVQENFNSMVDVVETLKTSHLKRESLVRKLSSALAVKKHELAQLNNGTQLDSDHLRSAAVNLQTKYREQSQRMKNLRHEKDLIKRRNVQLTEDLERANRDLEQMSHLKCEICF